MKISVCMIVKNEEAMLPRCLESVKDADQIAILDTGSDDGTEAAVAAMGLPNVRYIAGEYEWKDDFAHARNTAALLCHHEWLLTIDADEWLEAGGMSLLRAAIRDTPQARAFNLKTQAARSNSHHFSPRLYRNCPEHAWHGAAHNFQNIPRAWPCAAVIRYDHSPAHARDPERTIRILTAANARQPDNPRTLYYLGSEFFRRRRYNEAALHLQLCITAPGGSYYHAEAWLMLARCLWQLRRNKGNDAREACFRALEINANFAEAARFMAEISFEKNRAPWLAMAAAATNAGVMFVRDHQPQPACTSKQLAAT